MDKVLELADRLATYHSLTIDEYKYILENASDKHREYIRKLALEARHAVYQNKVFIRGLIEISNICKNNCFYCGIRGDNRECTRYRLSEDDIFSCCEEGHALGFKTFVLQGGEDMHFSDELLSRLLIKIKSNFPDCAVTLSLGERSYDSYAKLFAAGADRYLLRHETADKKHYAMLHPSSMSFDSRMECLYNLKSIGYQVGCGFMVGSPYQTTAHLAKDLKFIEEFSPDMCGIGPFIPHRSTPFSAMSAGSFELTLFLLSIVRLIKPTLLLPSTTALGTIHPNGRELGILAGANVIMPNLSPVSVRNKYELYNDKLCTGDETAEAIRLLSEKINNIGYEIVAVRGDAVGFTSHRF